MNLLDNPQQILKLDPDGMLLHLEGLPQQIEKAFEDSSKLKLPASYRSIDNIIIAGMGGSAIGGELMAGLLKETSKIPIYILRDYNLPSFVNQNSLLIAVSYSGNTEETISAAKLALKMKAKILALGSGGKLETLAKNHKIPFFKLSKNLQSRADLGEMIAYLVLILARIRVYQLGKTELKVTIQEVKKAIAQFKPTVKTSKNPAKQLALRLKGKIPVIFGSGIMTAVARRFKTQFNENAKTLAFFEQLPELNHNTVVGLEFPSHIKKSVFVIIITSHFDHPRNKLRVKILLEILNKRQIPYEVIKSNDKNSPLTDILTIIVLGDFTSYYLALLNKVDPTPIEIIDYLKVKLSEGK